MSSNPYRTLLAVVVLSALVLAVVKPLWTGNENPQLRADAASADEVLAQIAASQARKKEGPWIHAQAPVFDWGTVEPGTAIRHTFRLENRGTEPVKIAKARSSCGCGAFDFSREIPPGGEGYLSILIPGDKVHEGKLRASITLKTNARGDDVLVVTGRVAKDQ
jgi:hypothetical protein